MRTWIPYVVITCALERWHAVDQRIMDAWVAGASEAELEAIEAELPEDKELAGCACDVCTRLHVRAERVSRYIRQDLDGYESVQEDPDAYAVWVRGHELRDDLEAIGLGETCGDVSPL